MYSTQSFLYCTVHFRKLRKKNLNPGRSGKLACCGHRPSRHQASGMPQESGRQHGVTLP